MKNKITATTSITINAGKANVWKAITTPSQISKYLMGTHVSTDWKAGSPITYQGEYNGKSYQDKGTIIEIEKEKIFKSTYWSSMGGKPDQPENYNIVTYRLLEKGNGKTLLKLSQDNIGSLEEKAHSIDNWKMVLKKLKEVIEHRT